MINILHGLGLRFLALGHHTPFMVRVYVYVVFSRKTIEKTLENSRKTTR